MLAPMVWLHLYAMMISFYEATAYLSAGFLRKHVGKCFGLLSFIGDKTGNGDSETTLRQDTYIHTIIQRSKGR